MERLLSPATPLLLCSTLLLLLRLAFGPLDFSLPLPDKALPAVSRSLSMNLLADRLTGIAILWGFASAFSPDDATREDVGAELDDKVSGVADVREGELAEAIVDVGLRLDERNTVLITCVWLRMLSWLIAYG